jgi:putative hydrolase of HD superfamily
MSDAERLLKVLEDAARLKRTDRSGWSYYGVRPVESVADHSFGVAFLTLLVLPLLKKRGVELDEVKALKMALFHEIGEARLGDIHLSAKKLLGMETLSRAEGDAIREIFDESEDWRELEDLWREFEDRTSLEARLVRALDKIELFFQGQLYERFRNIRLDRIFDASENSRDMDVHPLIEELKAAILDRRKKGDQ